MPAPQQGALGSAKCPTSGVLTRTPLESGEGAQSIRFKDSGCAEATAEMSSRGEGMAALWRRQLAAMGDVEALVKVRAIAFVVILNKILSWRAKPSEEAA